MNREERRRQDRQASRRITGPGGPFDRHANTVDTRGAVLLDDVWTVVAHTGAGDVVGLELAGRVNHSSARASALYLMDAEGAGQLAADLVALAARAGGQLAEQFRAAFDAQLTASTSQEPRP